MTDKAALRTAIAAGRRQRSEQDRSDARASIRGAVLEKLAELELPVGARIAAYQPLATEPGSVELLVQLQAAGYEPIVPITLPDKDLDWARWTQGAHDMTPLGVAAISAAAVVLVPAFAVDPAGRRLGRGGGSYDRALARADKAAIIAALLFDDELIDEVPVDAWDVPVTAVVTPTGWRVLR